jgi:hypothetical protein
MPRQPLTAVARGVQVVYVTGRKKEKGQINGKSLNCNHCECWAAGCGAAHHRTLQPAACVHA